MDERLHVIVEIELDAASLWGTVRGGRAGEVPFVGWLGLIGAIEELRQSLVAGASDGARPGA